VIKQYEGNFSDYKDAREQRGGFGGTSGVGSNAANGSEQQKSASIATWKQKSNKPKFSYQEQKDYDTIDEQIAELESQIEETDKAIAESATNYSKLNELMKHKDELEKTLEEKMERWVYLNDLAEQIEAAKSEK
jgi:ATP-binding cassette subfamily F protein uup